MVWRRLSLRVGRGCARRRGRESRRLEHERLAARCHRHCAAGFATMAPNHLTTCPAPHPPLSGLSVFLDGGGVRLTRSRRSCCTCPPPGASQATAPGSDARANWIWPKGAPPATHTRPHWHTLTGPPGGLGGWASLIGTLSGTGQQHLAEAAVSSERQQQQQQQQQRPLKARFSGWFHWGGGGLGELPWGIRSNGTPADGRWQRGPRSRPRPPPGSGSVECAARGGSRWLSARLPSRERPSFLSKP